MNENVNIDGLLIVKNKSTHHGTCPIGPLITWCF